MRVDVLAIGSRGDVQPYVALGLGLKAAGYRVRVVTLGGFEELVRGSGLDHVTIGASPRHIAETAAGREWIRHRHSTIGYLRGFVRVAGELIEQGIAACWRACRDADVLIVSPMGLLLGMNIAERLRVPLIQGNLAPPVVRTRYDWDGRTSFAIAAGRSASAFGHAAFHFMIWCSLRGNTNAARSKILGLPPLPLVSPVSQLQRERVPMLCAYSSAVVPRVPDWGSWMHVTGYWFLDEQERWLPPSELVEFLGSGAEPVFIGFGSTPFPQPAATTELVVRAVTRAGTRAVLVAGGSGLATGRLSENVLSLDSVPHGWLFSRVSAAVHHGGAGVTGAALRAGLPSVVVPVFADQPFWGRRISHLRVGPRPIPARRLTEASLAEAIAATAGAEMRERAAALGRRIRGEDGVRRAVEIINDRIEGRTSVAQANGFAH